MAEAVSRSSSFSVHLLSREKIAASRSIVGGCWRARAPDDNSPRSPMPCGMRSHSFTRRHVTPCARSCARATRAVRPAVGSGCARSGNVIDSQFRCAVSYQASRRFDPSDQIALSRGGCCEHARPMIKLARAARGCALGYTARCSGFEACSRNDARLSRFPLAANHSLSGTFTPGMLAPRSAQHVQDQVTAAAARAVPLPGTFGFVSCATRAARRAAGSGSGKARDPRR